MRLLQRVAAVFRPRDPTPADPLDHPHLARLGLRELADLPMPRPEGAPAPSRRPEPAAEMDRHLRAA